MFYIKNKISACSAVYLILHSSYTIPAPENNLSDGTLTTLVGGEQRYSFASLAKENTVAGCYSTKYMDYQFYSQLMVQINIQPITIYGGSTVLYNFCKTFSNFTWSIVSCRITKRLSVGSLTLWLKLNIDLYPQHFQSYIS